MDRLRTWAETVREELRLTLAAMDNGQVHTRELLDGRFVDTTQKTIEQYQQWIAELDDILAGTSL